MKGERFHGQGEVSSRCSLAAVMIRLYSSLFPSLTNFRIAGEVKSSVLHANFFVGFQMNYVGCVLTLRSSSPRCVSNKFLSLECDFNDILTEGIVKVK